MKIKPQEKEKYQESVQVQMPLLFYFLCNNDCVQLVTYAIIQGNQIVSSWLFHVFNFVFIDRE